VNIGAGRRRDRPASRKDLEAEIQGGVGEATIRLPKDVGVVAVVTASGSIDTHGRRKKNGQYVNAAYGKCRPRFIFG